MTPYPHHYRASASGTPSGPVAAESTTVPRLMIAPPAEFGGPGDAWSPETLLVAAIANCIVLTFRAVARAAGFGWEQLECKVEGTLDRAGGVAQFTKYDIHAAIAVSSGADRGKAQELLERAERACLISNSLRGERTLHVVVTEPPPGGP
jgi:peroxiredoxin-like protein